MAKCNCCGVQIDSDRIACPNCDQFLGDPEKFRRVVSFPLISEPSPRWWELALVWIGFGFLWALGLVSVIRITRQ